MTRPKALESDSVLVKARVPATVATAINALATLSGTSRSALMRQIVVLGLATYELINADAATEVAATTYTHKEK